MIKHIVMFRLKKDFSPEEKQTLLMDAKQRMLAFKGVIPEIRSLEVYFGDSSAPETNYDYIMESTFDSMADIETYQAHPDHVAFGKFMAEIREERACADFEI